MEAPTSGVCRFCGITDAQVDGDKRSWLGASRTVCSAPACIRAHYAERDRAQAEANKARHKRTPAEIHQLMIQERRERRRRNRKGLWRAGKDMEEL